MPMVRILGISPKFRMNHLFLPMGRQSLGS
jgi:hypothetical protein